MKLWCGFSKNTNRLAVFSWLVSSIESRKYSHTYIRYQCPISGEMMVFQASKGIVNCMNYGIFLQNNEVVKEYEIECDHLDFKEFYKFKCQNLGKKYSFSQIAWFGLKKLLQVKQWPKTVYNLIYNGESEYICSEIAAVVCILTGIEISEKQLDQISPSDLDTILQNSLITYNIWLSFDKQ